jgi:curved DNA-binding protein CbpA
MPTPEVPRPDDARPLACTEIRTLARMVDELTYYDILKVEPGATSERIRAAYHRESRTFHPDSYLTAPDPALREAVNIIAKRIKEAYGVLRNAEKRAHYDHGLAASQGRRATRYTEETAQEAMRAREEAVGKTPQGRQFYRLAQADWKNKNTESALRNVKMALTYEPANDRFRALLDELVRSQRGRRDSA